MLLNLLWSIELYFWILASWQRRVKTPKNVTRARGSINSQKAKQLVLHLWMYQQSVIKKIIGAKESEESNVTRERLPRTSPDYSSSSDSSLSETSASLKPRCGTCTCSSACFCFVEVRFSFPFVLCWPQLKRVRLERDCGRNPFNQNFRAAVPNLLAANGSRRVQKVSFHSTLKKSFALI